MGTSVAGPGDVDRNGYSDVLVGANKYDCSGLQVDGGRVTLYNGYASGWSGFPAWTACGGPHIELGLSVAFADINGDRFSDAVIGAPFYELCGTCTNGAVYYAISGYQGLGSLTYLANGVDSKGKLGYSVSSAGDVDGD